MTNEEADAIIQQLNALIAKIDEAIETARGLVEFQQSLHLSSDDWVTVPGQYRHPNCQNPDGPVVQTGPGGEFVNKWPEENQ